MIDSSGGETVFAARSSTSRTLVASERVPTPQPSWRIFALKKKVSVSRELDARG